MKGVSATKFGPDTKMTRAMFVTVLYRMEGSPSVEGMQIPAFTDIGAKWCYDAIIWAYNAGVTLGKTATTFAPNDSITRAEIVTMVYRYSGSPTVSGVPNFTDAASVGAWARDAIIWQPLLVLSTATRTAASAPTRPLSAPRWQQCSIATWSLSRHSDI